MTRPLPILFIHGFNGSPENWRASGFLEALVARDADPRLLRLFHYGLTEGGSYNNQADIRRVAARLSRKDSDDPLTLDSQIVRLSEASVALGGPPQVTIVAHSMGGLIARYYLSRQAADEFGTLYDGQIARLISIGTPHQGMVLARVVNLVPQDSIVMKLLRALERWGLVKGKPSQELTAIDTQVDAMQRREVEAMQRREVDNEVTTQGYLDSPAVRQMLPGSAFLDELASPDAWPDGMESALIWGDIQVGAAVRWGPMTLWERVVTLGDLTVEASSAGQLPNANPQRYPFLWQRRYEVRVGDPAFAQAADINDFLPPVAHTNLLHNPEVHALVARLVGLTAPPLEAMDEPVPTWHEEERIVAVDDGGITDEDNDGMTE